VRPLALAVVVLLASPAHSEWPPPRPLDAARLSAAGLRVVRSEHATLVTDAAPRDAVDELPRLVDLALPQWAERFGVPPQEIDDWRLRVYLIEDEPRFRALGLWPAKSPAFEHGLSLGHETWIRQQTSDYYRRHLLLHEATHSFMATVLGSCGPGWYMEATAELCATHAWDRKRDELSLASPPATRDAAPDWGRVRLVRDAVDEGRLLSVAAVRKIDNRVVLPAESYAWLWAFASFLDDHPAYHERFAAASRWVTDPAFDERFDAAFAPDRRRLEQEWRAYATRLAYGYDTRREAIDFRDGEPLPAGQSRRVRVAAGRGWQSSGVAVERGVAYRIDASGRFIVAREPDGTPWPCTPRGVTIRYCRGEPLGVLLATVDSGAAAFVDGVAVGVSRTFEPQASGTLYLRVNDFANQLSENEGALDVAVSRATP